MTDRSKLLALAEAVEKLTGPDRVVDAQIAVAVQIGTHGLLEDDHEYLSAVRRDDNCAAGTYWFKCRSGSSLRTALPYTASLDAAMTLVGPESFFRLGNDGEGPDVAAYKATVTAGFAVVTFHDAVAATPALALCAAALRAQAEALA